MRSVSCTTFGVCSQSQGDVCPNGVPALMERGNNENETDSELLSHPWSIACALCIVPFTVPFSKL